MRLLEPELPSEGRWMRCATCPRSHSGSQFHCCLPRGYRDGGAASRSQMHRRGRTCFALFTPDEGGLVRPDVAERCWIVLASGGTSETAPPPEPAQFDALLKLGATTAITLGNARVAGSSEPLVAAARAGECVTGWLDEQISHRWSGPHPRRSRSSSISRAVATGTPRRRRGDRRRRRLVVAATELGSGRAASDMG